MSITCIKKISAFEEKKLKKYFEIHKFKIKKKSWIFFN